MLHGVLERKSIVATKLSKLQGVRREKIRIVATQLPKMGGKKKKERELWQPSCRKLGDKFNSNLGNEVAKYEGGGERKKVMI